MSIESFATIHEFENIVKYLSADEDYKQMKGNVISRHLKQLKNYQRQTLWSKFMMDLECYYQSVSPEASFMILKSLRSNFNQLLDDELFRINIREIKLSLCP
jgi:hypothetical protein